ncbi:MAG: TolC family protein [Ignavibacterium sp.]|nr:MAG: TolC family protein [Ignavibacterium sp.]
MRTFLLSIILTFFTVTIQAQEDLTLDKAIQIALHKNPTLLKSINSLDGFESNVQAATGNFLPTLSVGARWDWTRSDREGIGTTVINGNIVPIGATSTQTRTYNTSVRSSWTLFDGLANFATHSQSKTDLESAEFSLDRLKQDIVFSTTSLFYDVINTQKLLTVTEDNLKWNEKNLETIRERNKLGAATLADVYQQEVATGNAELEIIRTKNQLEVAKNDLLFYLGLDVLKEYTFSDEITDEEAEVLKTDLAEDYVKISEFVDEAFRNRLDYRSAQLDLESAKDGVTIAQSGHWPSLAADAIYFWQGNNLQDIDNTKTLNVGLGLNFPIFLGWSVTNQVQFAQVDVKNKEIELTDLERDIKRQLQQTFLDLQAAYKFLNVSENNIAAADENLKIEQEKYSLGSGKLLDVLVANSNYTTALTDLINAQFAYLVLSERLKYYVGVLDFSQYE